MKQFTSREQTNRLIRLGFPLPESISVCAIIDCLPRIEYDYSIGELISFLPREYGKGLLACVPDIITAKGLFKSQNIDVWCVEYMGSQPQVFDKEVELIDALYDMCVILKTEKAI